MNSDEQLLYETRVRNRMAIVAALAGPASRPRIAQRQAAPSQHPSHALPGDLRQNPRPVSDNPEPGPAGLLAGPAGLSVLRPLAHRRAAGLPLRPPQTLAVIARDA